MHEGIRGWVVVGGKAQWWSASQKKHFPVNISSIDMAKRVVIVTFVSDDKVWKSVPILMLGDECCPLKSVNYDVTWGKEHSHSAAPMCSSPASVTNSSSCSSFECAGVCVCVCVRFCVSRGTGMSEASTFVQDSTLDQQNDPQQHQREAKNRKCRAPHGGKRSPDSESARRELPKSGLDSHVGPQKYDFIKKSGWGTTAGAPTCTRAPPPSLGHTPLAVGMVGSARAA
jgi:hypothetical protein